MISDLTGTAASGFTAALVSCSSSGSVPAFSASCASSGSVLMNSSRLICPQGSSVFLSAAGTAVLYVFTTAGDGAFFTFSFAIADGLMDSGSSSLTLAGEKSWLAITGLPASSVFARIPAVSLSSSAVSDGRMPANTAFMLSASCFWIFSVLSFINEGRRSGVTLGGFDSLVASVTVAPAAAFILLMASAALTFGRAAFSS